MNDTCLHFCTFHNSTTKPAQFQVEILKNNFVKWNSMRKIAELFIYKIIRKKRIRSKERNAKETRGAQKENFCFSGKAVRAYF